MCIRDRDTAGDVCAKSIYIASSHYSLLADASLGLGQPEVKPSTSVPLPVRLKELPGKLGWMKWEPMNLTDAKVRGGGHKRSGKQAR